MKNYLHRTARFITSPFRFVRHCFTDCPKHWRCSTLALSALVNLALASFLLNGCGTTKAARNTEQQIYNTATNLVAKVQAVAPFLPAPIGTPVELVLGGVSALLTAWNVHQHQTLKAVKKAIAAPKLLSQVPPAPTTLQQLTPVAGTVPTGGYPTPPAALST